MVGDSCFQVSPVHACELIAPHRGLFMMDQKMSQSLVMISEMNPKEMRRTQNVDLMIVKGLWQGTLEGGGGGYSLRPSP